MEQMEKFELLLFVFLSGITLYFIIVTIWGFGMTSAILGSESTLDPIFRTDEVADRIQKNKIAEFERAMTSSKMNYFAIFNLLMTLILSVVILYLGYTKFMSRSAAGKTSYGQLDYGFGDPTLSSVEVMVDKAERSNYFSM